MPAGPVLLGLDLGTSGCKLLAFDSSGAVLARAHRSYPLRNPRPGFFELDADEVWDAAVACFREISQTSVARATVALSVSVQGEAITPVGRDGRCLAPTPVSVDARGA